MCSPSGVQTRERGCSVVEGREMVACEPEEGVGEEEQRKCDPDLEPEPEQVVLEVFLSSTGAAAEYVGPALGQFLPHTQQVESRPTYIQRDLEGSKDLFIYHK